MIPAVFRTSHRVMRRTWPGEGAQVEDYAMRSSSSWIERTDRLEIPP